MSGQQSMQDLIAARINSSGLQLPVFNAAVLDLQDSLNDQRIGNKQIESLIMKDPALVVQVLRLANGARFAGLNKIATIEQALMRLGTRQVCQLAIAAAQLSLYKSKLPFLQTYMTDSWNRAYASALGTSWLARRIGRIDLADAAFLSGLLHDVGDLLILMVIEQIAGKGGSSANFSAQLIKESLASLHCESGHMLMQRWNLPETYCHIARDHHCEEVDSRDSLLLMVRLMDQVGENMGIGRPSDPNLLPAASQEAQTLGASEIMLAELEVFMEESMGMEPA